MGANVFSRPQTQRDVLGRFVQVKGSRFDSVRRWQTPQNSLTRKRSLVQIQYGPRHFSKTCLALKGPRGASHLRFCGFVAGQSSPGCGPKWGNFRLARSTEYLAAGCIWCGRE